MTTWQKLKNNPGLWQRYFMREKLIKAIRSFFDTQGFHEVETPTLIGAPAAESYMEVFTTTLLDRKRRPTTMYLSTSPELPLKKLMVAGIGNCYSITKSFRNTETGSRTHNPEFTLVEWYRVGANYKDIMEDCEELILHLFNTVSLDHNKAKPCRQGLALNAQTLSYQDNCIDLAPPWERVSVSEAFQKWAHVDLEKFFDIKEARAVCKDKGYQVNPKNTLEKFYNQVFLNEVEPHLGEKRPVILYDFPFYVAALCKLKDTDPRFAERFEFYIAGLELGDCYTELTDPVEQKRRFEKELQKLKRLGKTEYNYDHDFIQALQSGMPPSSGIAVGVDRLIMLLTDTTHIADIMFFPLEDLL